MTSNPSPAIERQLREAWARKEWEYPDAQWEHDTDPSDMDLRERLATKTADTVFDYEQKDNGVPDNWRAQCKPPLDDEGDE